MCDQRVVKNEFSLDKQTEEMPSKTEINLSAQLSVDHLDVPALSLAHNFRPEILRKLVLTRNGLTTLPSSIGKFTELKELDVSSNKLTWISSEIAQLPRLKVLIARNNRLHNLPKDFQHCCSLEILNLSGNLYVEFPPELFQLSQIRDLHLGGNKICVVPANIGRIKRLQVLYLGGNKLTDIPPDFKRLKQLRHLYLCDNQLTNIPRELGRLKKLESLSLHKNFLTTLPAEILKLTHLQELTLRDNPLVSKFVRKLEFTPPTLLELCGRVVKTKNVAYDDHILPKQLISYLHTAKKCVNPKCDGVYFDSRVRSVQFMDFCGRFRLPLEQYLCSPNECEVDLSIDGGVDTARLRRVLLPFDVVSTSASESE